MPRVTSAKLLAAGTVVATVAAAVGVAIWQSDTHQFTGLAGFWAAVAVAVLGVMLFVVGVVMRDPSGAPPHQVQRAGDHSVAYQAGRDLHVEREERRRDE